MKYELKAIPVETYIGVYLTEEEILYLGILATVAAPLGDDATSLIVNKFVGQCIERKAKWN